MVRQFYYEIYRQFNLPDRIRKLDQGFHLVHLILIYLDYQLAKTFFLKLILNQCNTT